MWGVKLNVRPYVGSAVTGSNPVYGTYYAINLIISLSNCIFSNSVDLSFADLSALLKIRKWLKGRAKERLTNGTQKATLDICVK